MNRKAEKTRNGAHMTASVLEALLIFENSLDSRSKVIFRSRILSSHKSTLDAVGLQLGVTRERVRQLENGVKDSLAASGLQELARDELSSQLKDINPKCAVIPLQEAEKLLLPNSGLSDLGLSVSDFGTFTNVFEVDGKYLYFPNKVVIASLVSHIQTHDFEGSACRLENFKSLSTASGPFSKLAKVQVKEVLVELGWSSHGEFLFPPSARKFEDKFFIYLKLESKPVNLESVITTVFKGMAIRSCVNRIRGDDRFSFPTFGTVKIREEGDSDAKTIKDLLVEAIGEEDSIDFDDLTKFILKYRDASVASIKAYANIHPFRLKSGVVSRVSQPKQPIAQIARTKRIYRREEGWVIRIVVSAEMMRGSSPQLPTAIVHALDLPIDEKLEFRSSLLEEDIWVSWQGMQPRVQSVKSIVEKLGGKEGDSLLMYFKPESKTVHHQLVRFPLKESKLQGISALFGMPLDSTTQTISKMLMSDVLGGLSVLEILKLRREYDALDVWEGVKN